MRELVRPLYAKGGRPSVDPVVFFRLQLVMFFEDIRSERELMRVAADRLSVRWCTWGTTRTSRCPITPA
jgi:transposase